MRLVSVLAAVSLLVGPSAVLAEETHNHAGHSQAKAEKPKKICRRAEESSTSRMGAGKTCRTEAEWAEIDAKGGERNTNSRSVTSSTRMGNN